MIPGPTLLRRLRSRTEPDVVQVLPRPCHGHGLFCLCPRTMLGANHFAGKKHEQQNFYLKSHRRIRFTTNLVEPLFSKNLPFLKPLKYWQQTLFNIETIVDNNIVFWELIHLRWVVILSFSLDMSTFWWVSCLLIWDRDFFTCCKYAQNIFLKLSK